MSDLLVITFPAQESAGQAAERLKGLQHAQGLSIGDMAVVEKDGGGKLHVRHGVDTTTAGGAAVGGFLGLLLGLVFFPIAGLALGAAAGAFIGRSLHHNIDKQLIADVEADLTPGTSAIFVLADGAHAGLVGALEPFHGKVYQTNLDSETESQIQAALDRGEG
jgi:uncharacterized membrane protein